MELICPICNGIGKFYIKCPVCGAVMVNEGPVVDYLDDYSPYLSNEITQRVDGATHDKCIHLYQCSHCGRDMRIQIDRVRI